MNNLLLSVILWKKRKKMKTIKDIVKITIILRSEGSGVDWNLKKESNRIIILSGFKRAFLRTTYSENVTKLFQLVNSFWPNLKFNCLHHKTIHSTTESSCNTNDCKSSTNIAHSMHKTLFPSLLRIIWKHNFIVFNIYVSSCSCLFHKFMRLYSTNCALSSNMFVSLLYC